MSWFIVYHALAWLGIIGGWAACLCYFLTAYEADKAHLNKLRAEEFAQAQRSISHNRT